MSGSLRLQKCISLVLGVNYTLMKALNQDWEKTPIDLEVEVLVDEKPKKIKSVFCKNWDVARTALEIAKSAVKKPIAKVILTIAIRIGDGIYTRNCG